MDFKSYCLKEEKEYLLSEWDAEKKLPYSPDNITHSSIPIWWKCQNGHSWQTQLKSRSLSRTRCPKCNEERRMVKMSRQLENLKQK